MARNPHQPLRDDINLLGRLLGEVIAEVESPSLYQKVEKIRKFSKSESGHKPIHYQKLLRLLESLSLTEQKGVSRAFTEFLRLSNIAEQFHRVRRRREYEQTQASPQPGSLGAFFNKFKGLSPNRFEKAFDNFEVDLVFTAHPTEAMRPSAIRKYKEIALDLDTLSRSETPDWERELTLQSLKRRIFILWKIQIVRPSAPSPFEEALSGFSTIEEDVWPIIPRLFQKIQYYYQKRVRKNLPLSVNPIKFSSWIGGDRDGNPFVTAEVTRQVLDESMHRASLLYTAELDLLIKELPFSSASMPFKSKYDLSSDEPYRELFQNLRNSFKKLNSKAFGNFLETLLCAHQELINQGLETVAEGRLSDLIRRARVFGPALQRLDIRQEKTLHRNAMSEILGTTYKYAELNEDERIQILLKLLDDPKSVKLASEGCYTMETREVLSTMRVLCDYPRDCFGGYIVSMASEASEILEPYVLQAMMGVRSTLYVCPLFETPESLDRSVETLRELFELKAYQQLIGRKQYVMLGYSDSAKREGRLSSSWQIYQKQREIVGLCRDYKVQVSFFHGRGGSIARGGGPVRLAMQSIPRGVASKQIRITEQGESIHAKFGLPEIALRTLELYLAGSLEAIVSSEPVQNKSWSSAMERLAQSSADAFQKGIYKEPGFLEFMDQITPEKELGLFKIGSRPKKREGKASFEKLRAIPWVFAWTQTRLLIPSWFGLGEGLLNSKSDWPELRKAYRKWPFFFATMDLLEMVLAKTHPEISKLYSQQLVDPELQALTTQFLDSYSLACKLHQKISGHRRLLENYPVLNRSIRIRNNYVDVLNILQIILIKSNRKNPSAKLEEAIAVTISGISAGMRNTG